MKSPSPNADCPTVEPGSRVSQFIRGGGRFVLRGSERRDYVQPTAAVFLVLTALIATSGCNDHRGGKSRVDDPPGPTDPTTSEQPASEQPASEQPASEQPANKAAQPGTADPRNELSIPKQTSSHDRMLALLSDIARRTPAENMWLGDQFARHARTVLAKLPSGTDPAVRFKIHQVVGVEEGRLGNEQAAIDQFTRAASLLDDLQGKVPAALSHDAIFQLGVAHLRRGETENCCRRNTSESCIMPIRGQGLHSDPSGSKQAIRYFMQILRAAPKDSPVYLKSQWLLNIAYMTIGGYPDQVPAEYRIAPSVFESEMTIPRFKNIAPQLKINTFDLCGGAIADDFDNDGYLDLVTTTSDTQGQTRWFRNNADGTFSERTKEAGLTGILGGLNCLQADYDNDGNLDILVLRGAWYAEAGRHPNSLLHNNGDGTFTDVTFEAKLADKNYPTQTGAWADYDLDGDLDLYVGNEHSQAVRAPGQLFRNNGDGTFTDVARAAGVENLRFAKGVVWGDYDGDRFPDLYVSNLQASNRLYHNNGDGTFTDVAMKSGVDKPLDSFPIWFWDFDNDGSLDLYVPSYRGDEGAVAHVAASYLGLAVTMEKPCLYRGDGRGGFQDVAEERNLRRILLPMGANFGDLDNDGYLDFYLGTGYPHYEALMPSVMYLSQAGRRFVDVTHAGGLGHLQKGHGIAFADFDHDGDQDIFAQMGGNFPGDKFGDAFYENPGFGNHWITIQLVGRQSNRSAIGARIHLLVAGQDGSSRSIYRHVNSGGSFGANPLRQTLGLGTARRIDKLEVYWPKTDRTQRFENVPADQIIRIVEDQPDVEPLTLPSFQFDTGS